MHFTNKYRLTAFQDSAECKTQGIQSTLSNQLVEIHETMMNKGVEAVINLWNSWYLPSSRNLSQTSSFRIINPSFPEAVGLLRARLTALTLYSDYEINGKSSPTAASNSIIANEDDTEFHDTYQQRRQFLSSEVTKSRELLDLLATSQWGSHCPEFWLLYLQFEKTIGDITQVPAVQWRAQKTLVTECFDKFILMLNEEQE
ncbi:U3 small nucleolar RNA-associated protein 6 [Schistosoma japonicum]|nr:U3 small nucleolar RNA-associated protein 6 [Schistosoma japonicum]